VPIQGDRQYLIQMLTNLVENALKYAGENDKTVTVETGCCQIDEVSKDDTPPRGWVRVIDNGPGIPPEHLPHLFDRFYRADSARGHLDDLSSSTSSGLGLAIVQWIAQAHGGGASVTSEVGKGSTFEVWLPLFL
jgi:signal transduction histidine kinase